MADSDIIQPEGGGGLRKRMSPKPRIMGGRRLFQKSNPGSPGRLGKTSTTAESLSKLRGKGAIA